MTEHIDHAAKARTLERNAWAKGGPDGDSFIRTHEQRQDMILSAQMHATLALVEQQRIANVVALASLANEQFGGYAGEAGIWGQLFDHPETEHGNARLKPAIRKGLGL